MFSWLWLGWAVMAANPDAGIPALPEPLQAVASCALPIQFVYVDWKIAKFMEVEGRKAVSFRSSINRRRTTELESWEEWLVYPETCRSMALHLECDHGEPNCAARIIHLPGQPPTETERLLLRSWLGGEPRDPQRPDHQSAFVEHLPDPPSLPDSAWAPLSPAQVSRDEAPPAASAKREPAPITLRAVRFPPRNWIPGPLVPQTRSWTESETLEEPHALDEGPKDFVASGRVYSLHRSDLYVRPALIDPVGPSRLTLYSSAGSWPTQSNYVALEQPKQHRSQWLFITPGILYLLGVHGRRIWLENPAHRYEGVFVEAIDLDTGTAWVVALNPSPSIDPRQCRAGRVTRKGLPITQTVDEEGHEKTMLIPWETVEQALREAAPRASNP